MRFQFAVLGVVLGLTVSGTSLAQSSSIYGVYGQCFMACRYIKIKSDHTFEELLDGDLFNGQRKKGTWTAETKTRIRAQSQKPSSSLRVSESGGLDKNFLVTVVDMEGAFVPAARVSGNANGKDFECVTSDAGTCEIPKVSRFDVKWDRFTGNYIVRNSAATRYQVEFTYEQMDTVIDEVWMIKGKHLYIEVDGSFDKADPLKKVSTKEARRLFPEN
jgi:hypothetical protein